MKNGCGGCQPSLGFRVVAFSMKHPCAFRVQLQRPLSAGSVSFLTAGGVCLCWLVISVSVLVSVTYIVLLFVFVSVTYIVLVFREQQHLRKQVRCRTILTIFT